MMKFSFAAFIILILSVSFSLSAQTDVHRWKPLIVNDSEKMWYDALMLDKMEGDKLDMWVLQMHKPPLKFDGIKGEIYRSKILYAINFKTVRYGIEKVVYYDAANQELYKHDYESASLPENVKYTYPILEDSFMYALVKEVVRIKGVQQK
ncbi:MAG: hypothetical protein K8H86_13770 [Ignavibacteriaceae bacterium]|nr:hypothetical protein [Ignavibacteriaceae bacterium]